jgi:diguanylate cyclase (GGDEF)-like protein/PAS domain S-box-containing protein
MPSTPAPAVYSTASPVADVTAAWNSARRTGAFAWGGLAVVLIFLTAFSGWVALSTYQASERVRHTSTQSDLFEQARYAVGAEESLERKYRLEPGVEVFAKHSAAAADLVSALGTVAAGVDGPDRELAREVLSDHGHYLASIARMFIAVDAGDTELVNQIDENEVDPIFDAIEGRVDAAAGAHRAEALRELEALGQTQGVVVVTTPIVFVIGLGLLGLFWMVMRGYQRRLDDGSRRELDQARHDEERFRALVQHTSDVILILDAQRAVRYASPAAEHGWGYAPAALHGIDALTLVHPDDTAAALSHLDGVLRQLGATHTTELRLRQADGSWREVEVIATNLLDRRAVSGIVLTYRDVTERKAYERELQRLAFHDVLTGLPNRALFTDRLDRALAHGDRDFRSVGVLFLDIDNFKVVNDSLGHQQGDTLLSEVAARIRSCVRPDDSVARIGGDEFTVLLEEVSNQVDATEMGERIVGALSRPILLGGREVFVSASIGVALSVPRHDTPDSLLRNADLAMYRAKSDGKARIAVFDRSMEERAVQRMEIETEMRSALERGEFEVFYQPIFSLADQRITELEALVRWRKPDGRLVLPTNFIPIAEETGLIVPLGQWVLDQACDQTRRWQDQYPATPPLGISVNLSARQFQNPHLIEDVKGTLDRTGLDPACLKLEVTESVAMQDPEATANTLRALKGLGLRLAIDDFGTGYSSLSYLKRFPVDTLKIDRSFVDGLGSDTQSDAIVQSVIALARALNLSTTGEGIETSSQQEHLRTLGCDMGQGFLFARPAPATAIEVLLRGNAELPQAA